MHQQGTALIAATQQTYFLPDHTLLPLALDQISMGAPQACRESACSCAAMLAGRPPYSTQVRGLHAEACALGGMAHLCGECAALRG